MKRLTFCFSALLLAACSGPAVTPQDLFLDNLRLLCGQSFSGEVISEDPQDDEWRVQTLTVHVRDCSETEIKMPLHVGENRSRTWIVTRTDDGLRLKHDHRHEDGHPDAVTMYGGDTDEAGSATKQSFPVDQESIDMFNREGLEASVTNIWSLKIEPGASLTYQLAREGRDFRAKFDLTQPVPTPPPAWGHSED